MRSKTWTNHRDAISSLSLLSNEFIKDLDRPFEYRGQQPTLRTVLLSLRFPYAQ